MELLRTPAAIEAAKAPESAEALAWCAERCAEVKWGSAGVVLIWDNPSGRSTVYALTLPCAVTFARVSLGETEAGAPEITSDAFASAAETTPPVTAPAPTDDAESVRVERVAKALYEARRDDWNVSWEELGESPREKCLAAASVLVRLANGEL